VCDDLPHAPVQTSCKFLASFLFCRELYSFQVCCTNHQAGSRYEGLPFFSHDYANQAKAVANIDFLFIILQNQSVSLADALESYDITNHIHVL
jgi:hypothetical protein